MIAHLTYCRDCRALRACKHTFGEWWSHKSDYGKGCLYPLTAEHAAAVEDVLDAKSNANKPTAATATKPAKGKTNAQIVMERLLKMKRN